MLTRSISVLAVAAALSGCAVSPDEPSSPEQCGVSLEAMAFRAGDGARDRGFSGGVSLADVDDDGDLDLMTTGGYSPVERPMRYRANTLYINDGAGVFSHAPDSEFTVADNAFSGSTWGDVDQDGDLDAFVATQHGRPDVFVRNLGGGHFAREPLGEATTTNGSNFTATWVDIDGDNDLDLVSGGPTLELPAPLFIYRNDGGVFTRVSGLPIENEASNGGAVLWADFDNDGDPDQLVANSDVLRRSGMDPARYEAPQIYRNDGNWSFERTEDQGFDDITYNSSVAATGDIDNDGDLDLYFANFSGSAYIFLNDGAGQFTRDARFSGPTHEGWATGATFTDLDLDGDLDLVAAGYNWPIRIWVNNGTGAFALDDRFAGRISTYSGAAAGDLDGDGDLDVVLGNWGETVEGEFPTLLTNQSTLCGSPLRVQLRDHHGARDPLNARVTLVTLGPTGERRQLRESMGQTSFRSQSGDAFLFGIPRGERFVRLEVRWPDGHTQIVSRVNRNGVTVVRAQRGS